MAVEPLAETTGFGQIRPIGTTLHRLHDNALPEMRHYQEINS